MSKTQQLVKLVSELYPDATDIQAIKGGANGDPFIFSDGGKRLLIKFIKPNRREKDLSGNEINTLKAVHSEYVIPLLNKGDIKKNNERQSYLVFPFVDGKDLADIMADKPLDSDVIRKVALGIVYGIRDLWSQGIVHRDIKPRNIRIADDYKVTIIDLGIARFRDDIRKGKGKGSFFYSSPEQIQSLSGTEGQLPHINLTISFTSDLWSLGVMMYQMATGKYPFDEDNVTESIANDTLDDPLLINKDLDEQLAEVIQRLTEKHPSNRYTSLEELISLLEEKEYEIEKKPFKFYFHQGASVTGGFSYFKDFDQETDIKPDGIIFSARYIPKDISIIESMKSSGYEILIDPETFVLAKKTEEWTAGLQKLPYFEPALEPGSFAGTGSMRDWASAVIDFQEGYSADAIIAPYFFMKDMRTWVRVNNFLISETKALCKELGIDKPIYAVLAVGNELVKDRLLRTQLLDSFFHTDGIAGFYLLAAEEREGSKPSSDAQYLEGLREIVSKLSCKHNVILGRADANAVFLSMDNLMAFSSNPAQSMRKFDFDEEAEGAGFGTKVNKVFVPDLFTFLREEEYQDIESRGLSIGKCHCTFCASDTGKYAKHKHFICEMTKLTKSLSDDELDVREKRAEEIITKAKDSFKVLKDNKVPLHQQSKGDFIEVLEQVFVDIS